MTIHLYNTLAREKWLTENYDKGVNPIIYGAAKTEKYLNILRACSEARLEALGW